MVTLSYDPLRFGNVGASPTHDTSEGPGILNVINAVICVLVSRTNHVIGHKVGHWLHTRIMC